ncbi:MAG: acyltransferase family protein [Candidatus Nanopelagicaceae bacterium]|nr:acyltransferase family protein [Candidatus Nanopelagicaceae bacterium]
MAAKQSIRHIAAIDGLRAVAVIAVLLYHLGFSWIPGGFLGVDLFFVISGYVITRLLLDSIQRSGGLDLRGFYAARLRRLFPALIFMMVSTALFVGVWAPEAIKRFLTDIPFVLTGSMNWALVYRHQDYFEAIGRPPLLQHTWSLAVESQFYLVWPLILLLVLKRFGKKKIPSAALAIAAVSGAVLLILSLRLDASSAQRVSHVYFGTDTHSIGLFFGAALAVSWIPQNLSTKITKRAQDFVDGIGVIGLLGILACFLFIKESDATLYQIAFPLAGIFGCAIIISLVHPASRFAPLLSNKPILWIGERSYAIYLWHWIIFQVTRPTFDLAGATWALYALRILIVFALADISLRWVELPVRSGAVESWFRGMKYRTKKVRIRQKSSVFVGLLILIVATSLVSANALTQSARLQEALKASLEQPAPIPTPTSTIASTPKLWVAGDSVILGIRNTLDQNSPIGLINARVGRQAAELITVLRHDKAAMQGSPVILDLGNNNRLTREEINTVFEEVKDQPQIIMVNTAVPRSWRDPNNVLIDEFAKKYPNATIVDWNAISKGHPEYFGPDGVHLVPAGINVYVGAIMKALAPIK